MGREICQHGVVLLDRDDTRRICVSCADKPELEAEVERLREVLESIVAHTSEATDVGQLARDGLR